MGIIDNIYQNYKKLVIVGAVAAIALVSYIHPIPITRNWGDIATQDMKAKTEIVYNIKRDVARYSVDGVWDDNELVAISASTSSNKFITHREEALDLRLGTFPIWDIRRGHLALDDLLFMTYNQVFNGSNGDVKEGELASYDKFREALTIELYKIFKNKDSVTYEEFNIREGFDEKISDETNIEWFSRHFNGVVDLNSSSLDEKLDAELNNVAAYFSSKENQDALRKKAESMEVCRDQFDNFVVIFLSSLIVYLGYGARKSKV